MKAITLISILMMSLPTTRIYAQNIFSALHHDRGEEIGEKVPIEIIEDNTFFNLSGKEVKKNKKKLNPQKKVLLEERFGADGKLEARLTYTYDSSNSHCLTRKIEWWTIPGYSSETAFFEYDNHWCLIKVTDKTDKGEKIRETVLTNNEKGDPVKLELYDGHGNAYGVELATYDYNANKAYTEVRNNKGNSLSQDTLTINFTGRLDAGIKYNDKGDIVQSSASFYEYEYDDFGNWTKMKIFKNVKGKKKNDRVFKRKFKYSD